MTRWLEERQYEPRQQAHWVRVTRSSKCPICEKPSWCSVSEDGTVVRCMRIQSEYPSESIDGAVGYIHRLGDTIGDKAPRPVRKHYSAKPTIAIVDFQRVLDSYKSRKPRVGELAKELGVSRQALQSLHAVYSTQRKAWAFPMRDAKGKAVGIRFRGDSGHKWALTGSKQGLFYSRSSLYPVSQPVYICEGPTDTAALMTIGVRAIGRPDCHSGSVILREMLHGQTVVIVSDQDEPGQVGAAALQSRLQSVAASCTIILPPSGIKDARQWVANGLTAEELQTKG